MTKRGFLCGFLCILAPAVVSGVGLRQKAELYRHRNKTVGRTYSVVAKSTVGEVYQDSAGEWTGATAEYLAALAQIGHFRLQFHDCESNATAVFINSTAQTLRECMQSGKFALGLPAKHFQPIYVPKRRFTYILPPFEQIHKYLYVVDKPVLATPNKTVELLKIFQSFAGEVWLAIFSVIVGLVLLVSAVQVCRERRNFAFIFISNAIRFISNLVLKKSASTDNRKWYPFEQIITTSFNFLVMILAGLFNIMLLARIALEPGVDLPFHDLDSMQRAGYRFYVHSYREVNFYAAALLRKGDKKSFLQLQGMLKKVRLGFPICFRSNSIPPIGPHPRIPQKLPQLHLPSPSQIRLSRL